MDRSFEVVLNFVRHYKYLIVVVIGIAVVGFLDENSLLRRFQYELQISELKDQIKKYNDDNEKATMQLRELQYNPHAIEKVARERYFMKADDEDIYVLSTDENPNANPNDSVK